MANSDAEGWFRVALEGSNVAAFVTDEHLRYLSVVNSLVLGDEGFFLGQRPRDLFMNMPGGPELCDAYDRVLETGEKIKVQVQIGQKWLDVALHPYNLANGRVGVTGTGTDITQQKIALREQAHRTKNAFTMAMAMASHTARGMNVPLEFKDKLHARLEALSKSQDAVSQNGGACTTFKSLVKSQIGHAIANDPDRFIIDDADCFIGADIAQYITLAVYELYTNAVKYGALSQEDGKVKIECASEDGMFNIVWTESGGPSPDPDAEPGFGRKLVTSIIPSAARGKADFDLRPEGLVWKFSAPLCAGKSR